MDDKELVARLRAMKAESDGPNGVWQVPRNPDGREAADRIEALTAKAEALAEALRDCAEDLAEYVNAQWGFDERLERQLKRDMAPVERARAALKAWEDTDAK